MEAAANGHNRDFEFRWRYLHNPFRLAPLNRAPAAVEITVAMVIAPPIDLVYFQALPQSRRSFAEAMINELLDTRFGIHCNEFAIPGNDRQGGRRIRH